MIDDTEIGHVHTPLFNSMPFSWSSETASDHVVKMSIAFDYILDLPEKPEDDVIRKYYITYVIGGSIEGKVCII